MTPFSTENLPGSWRLRETDEAQALRLSRELGLHILTARILTGRGFGDPQTAEYFLSPALEKIPDPFSIPQMQKAAERLAEAIAKGERIAIFGDYDVDGIAGTALLAEFLEALGVSPLTLLPDRFSDGYGLSVGSVDEMAARGARLILTVDNGTRAIDAVERASSQGIDVIITDHHDAGPELPRATAIVNPRMMEPDSPLRDISGCGVAFMLALALRRLLRERGLLPDPEPNLRRCLDLVALGTIADVVPLVGVNRVLVRFGLAELATAHRAGVSALMKISSTASEDISPGTVAFRLAPRINAAGRMGDAHESLALLRCMEDEEAMSIASSLESMNRERQRIEERMLEEALEMIGQAMHTGDGAIVVHAEGWHQGVIGIVAAKLSERSRRPAVVIAGSSPARGSARSGGSCDLVEALSCCSDCLVRFGGHPMAAGLSILPERVGEFRQRFSEACAAQLKNIQPHMLSVDAIANPADVTSGLVEDIARMQPFGSGNPEPVLAFASSRIIDKRIVGSGHLKLRLEADGKVFNAIGFNMAESLKAGTARAALAFSPQLNTWNGVTSVQLKIKELVPLEN